MNDALIERVARAIYETRQTGALNCWDWQDSGLDDEHPGSRARYIRHATAALTAIDLPALLAAAHARGVAEGREQAAKAAAEIAAGYDDAFLGAWKGSVALAEIEPSISKITQARDQMAILPISDYLPIWQEAWDHLPVDELLPVTVSKKL